MLRRILVACVAVVCAAVSNGPAFSQSGWQSNGYGGVYGTGRNSGAGWQSNGYGGYYGTGSLSGRSCQANGYGGLNCN